MIISISSDIPSFKTLRFRRGLNILLADVTSASTEGQTRNSAGKSSVVEIIHFMLGGDVDKSSLFRAVEIEGHSFTAVLRIKGKLVRVTRNGAEPKKILMDIRRAGRLGLKLDRDEDTGRTFLTVDDWKDFLGSAWFSLPLARADTDFEKKRSPTFRMLFGYFARRSRDIGFAHVSRFAERQPESDGQVSLSYLLGLDWRVPREIRELKDRQSALSDMRKAIKAGDLGQMFGGTTAELRPEVVRAEGVVTKLREQVDGFQVLESYRELAAVAADLRAEMTKLSLNLATAKNTVEYLEHTVNQEEPPSFASVDTLYKAVGIELPAVVRRRFEDVQTFQASVVANRRSYLREQVEEARSEVADIENQLAEAGGRRSLILRDLQGKGAFEDLSEIHRKLAQATNRLEILREKLINANILENKIAERKKDSAELELRLQKDYELNAPEIATATRLVDAAIGALYDDRTGNLLIAPTKNGPTFTVTIGGGGNQGGIDQMKVFCFDMMLYECVSGRLGGPKFLVHDSHLFDGVDPRQTKSALLLGSEIARRTSGQYIVLLNSDNFEKLGDEDWLLNSVLPTRFTDTDSGGVFGFRFELPDQRR